MCNRPRRRDCRRYGFCFVRRFLLRRRSMRPRIIEQRAQFFVRDFLERVRPQFNLFREKRRDQLQIFVCLGPVF